MDSLIKTHFLKQYVTSTDDNALIANLPPRRQEHFFISPKDKKSLSKKITECGFRLSNLAFTKWAKKMETLHSPTWRQAGIFEAIKASMVRVPKDESLILALVEKCCPETNSFVFPWGEVTITLEDVTVLLGFSVLGSCVNAPLKGLRMREAVARLERGRVENKASDGRVGHNYWIRSFRDCDDGVADGVKIEHEAFLTVWLSDFVFPDAWRLSISGSVLPLAVRLARGERIALAPAVLASVYRDLSRVHEFGRCKPGKRIKLESLFKLVQVWVWERFKNIGPEARGIQKREPRIARWGLLENKCEENRRLCFDEFVWRPYVIDLKNWSRPPFYVEEAKSVSVDGSLDDEFALFARCLRVSCLVGIGFVEDYNPNRVAMQFGFDQELPRLVTRRTNFTKEEAWDDYNKTLDGLKVYIPSRLAQGSVTKRYQAWWFKSVSEFMSFEDEQNETLNVDDESPKVLPLSQMFQKSRKGFNTKIKSCKKRRKVKYVKGKIGDCGGSTSREVPLSEVFHKKVMKRTGNMRGKRAREDDDDNITIAKMVKSREKTEGDASESLDDEVHVRFDVKKGIGKIDDCGGSSTSREMPLSELFQELAKRTSEHLRNKRACEDDDISIAEMLKYRKITKRDGCESLGRRSRLEENNNGVDNTVAAQEIEPRIDVHDVDEEKTGHEAEKITGVIVGSNVGTVVSPQEAMQKRGDVNGSNKEMTMTDVGTREDEYLVHGDNQREKLCCEVEKEEEEEIDERLKHRTLRVEEIALDLEARIMKAEKTLAKIRDWKTKRNQIKQEAKQLLKHHLI